MAQLLPVLPGHKILVNVSFSASFENEIIVEDQASGTRLYNAINFGAQPRHWESPVNQGPGTHLYLIRSQHKNGPPSGSLPWIPSGERILFANATNRIIGYEDATDGDFNDASANVVWI